MKTLLGVLSLTLLTLASPVTVAMAQDGDKAGDATDLTILINFDGNDPEETIDVSISGEREIEIHKSDLESLGLEKSDLKDGLKAIFGKKPDDVSLGYGDEYADNFKKNEKSPATAHIKASEVAWEVGDIVEETTVASSTYVVNCSETGSTATATVGAEAYESVSESWSRSFTVGVSFSVSAGYGAIGASAEVSASTTVGESNTQTLGTSTWSELSQDVELDPWQCKKAELQIATVTVPVDFTFETDLGGSVLGHYGGGYNPPDYSGGSAIYWFADFDKVVAESNVKPDYTYTMTVDVDYPVSGEMVIIDIECTEDPSYPPDGCTPPESVE